VSSSTGIGCSGSVSAADDDAAILLGDLIRGGLWTAPSLSIAARLHGKSIRHLHLDPSAARPTLIDDEDATPENIKESPHVRACDVLHISCHGMFAGGGESLKASMNPAQVLDSSGLLFYNRTSHDFSLKRSLLSMTDIWSLRLGGCRLACIVSSSSGVVNTRSQSDECLSVGTAFLVAGVRHVVCALWPLELVSVVLVMSRFYQNLYERSVEVDNQPWSIARCLAEAQSWYRTLTPDEYSMAFERESLSDVFLNHENHRPDNRDFYNWAAFTVLGPPE
jgi:CHAT domain-containing protein